MENDDDDEVGDEKDDDTATYNRHTYLTHSHSERPKQAWQFWQYFSFKSTFWKIFQREMLTRRQTTTLLQIFCELLLYSQVIFKSMKVADNIL